MAKEKKYQDQLMDQAKGHIKLGMLTGIGTYGFRRVGAAHPATQPTAMAVSGGLQLTNVAKLAETGMVISGAQKKKGKTGDKYIDRMI